MRFSLVIVSLLALSATIAPAVYSGLRNFRWGPDTELERLSEQLLTLPEQIGDWRQVDQFVLDSTSRDMLQPFASLSRRYTNGQQLATVFLLLGPTGPTAVHTPDICFNSRDFDPMGKRKTVRVNGESAIDKSQLWQLDFQNKGLAGNVLRSWYGWTIDGNWQASKDPRVEFADSRHLFKFQVVVPYATSEAMNADKSAPELVQGIQQHLRNSVFANGRGRRPPM